MTLFGWLDTRVIVVGWGFVAVYTVRAGPGSSSVSLRFSYKQAQLAVMEAIPKLHKLGVATQRPADYYAEMAKSDDHMKKVKISHNRSICQRS